MLNKVKIRCENVYWSAKVQRCLEKEIGATWGSGIEIPWNCRRTFLVVGYSTYASKWFITWATSWDFDECDAPEYTARELYQLRPTKD